MVTFPPVNSTSRDKNSQSGDETQQFQERAQAQIVFENQLKGR